jgi:hypothetical protein
VPRLNCAHQPGSTRRGAHDESHPLRDRSDATGRPTTRRGQAQAGHIRERRTERDPRPSTGEASAAVVEAAQATGIRDRLVARAPSVDRVPGRHQVTSVIRKGDVSDLVWFRQSPNTRPRRRRTNQPRMRRGFPAARSFSKPTLLLPHELLLPHVRPVQPPGRRSGGDRGRADLSA